MDRGAFSSTSSWWATSTTEVVRRIIEQIARGRLASFLAVLKRFGAGNPGPLSFPRPGWTLALDLPVGTEGLGPRCSTQLDDQVASAGGRVYLAKDSRLSPTAFRAMYPGVDRVADGTGPGGPRRRPPLRPGSPPRTVPAIDRLPPGSRVGRATANLAGKRPGHRTAPASTSPAASSPPRTKEDRRDRRHRKAAIGPRPRGILRDCPGGGGRVGPRAMCDGGPGRSPGSHASIRRSEAPGRRGRGGRSGGL